jgi:hypothetical protein
MNFVCGAGLVFVMVVQDLHILTIGETVHSTLRRLQGDFDPFVCLSRPLRVIG